MTTEPTDWLAQQPGESRAEWKERTFAFRYGQNRSYPVAASGRLSNDRCPHCGAVNHNPYQCTSCGRRL